VDRLTRHELKTDKFVEEVNETVHFVSDHRSQVVRYGGIALAVLVVAGGLYFFMKSRAEARQTALSMAIQTYNAPVTQDPPPSGVKYFPTTAAKLEAVTKELNTLKSNYSGSEEAAVATYLLACSAADQGKTEDAAKLFRQAANDAGKEYGSLAKLSLADLAASEGRTDEAEKLYRELVASPTIVVAKDYATLRLTKLISKTKPAEAKKLLEEIITAAGPASRAAVEQMGDLNQPAPATK